MGQIYILPVKGCVGKGTLRGEVRETLVGSISEHRDDGNREPQKVLELCSVAWKDKLGQGLGQNSTTRWSKGRQENQ